MAHKNCSCCKSSEINKGDNFCKICGLDLRGEAAAVTTAKIFFPETANGIVVDVVKCNNPN